MVFIYSLFSVFLGQNGLFMKRNLEAEKSRISLNQTILKNAGNEYNLTKDYLLNDNDALSVYARQLGYSRNDEDFIRIMGLGISAKSELPAGQVFYALTPAHVPDKVIKLIAAFFGFIVFLFLLINDSFSIKNKLSEFGSSFRGRFSSR